MKDAKQETITITLDEYRRLVNVVSKISEDNENLRVGIKAYAEMLRKYHEKVKKGVFGPYLDEEEE